MMRATCKLEVGFIAIFYSGIEKYPSDFKGEQIDLSGNPRGDLDFFGVDLFSSNTYSFDTFETEAGASLGNNSGNYSAITPL